MSGSRADDFEQLSAYADGALPADEMRAMERAIASDPELQRMLADIEALNRDLGAAFDAPMRAAPPERLTRLFEAPPAADASIRTAVVTRFEPRRARKALRAALPLAAALAVGIGVGSVLFGGDGQDHVAAGFAPESGALAHALETTPMGEAAAAPGGSIALTATLLDGAGRVCREFELMRDADPSEIEFGLACRSDDARWHVEFAATAKTDATPDGRVTPANGPARDALGVLLDRLGAGVALTADEEAALIEAGWRTR